MRLEPSWTSTVSTTRIDVRRRITKKEVSAAGAGLFFRAGDSPRGLADQIELADMPVYIHHAVRYVDINGHMEI